MSDISKGIDNLIFLLDEILKGARKLKEYAETFQTRITNDIIIELEEKFKILSSGIELITRN